MVVSQIAPCGRCFTIGSTCPFDRDWYITYRRVNRLFAEQLYPYLRDDDLVWIHDYHLIPMGEELRRLGVKCRLGFFCTSRSRRPRCTSRCRGMTG